MEEKLTSVGSGRIGGNEKDGNILQTFSGKITIKTSVSESLTEGSGIFTDYLDWLGLSSDPSIIVISPSHHYYYDLEDFKGVKTVLNLKLLNHIKELRELLLTVNCMLSRKSHFIGGFIDRNHQNSHLPAFPTYRTGIDPVENGIASRNPILNMIYDFVDSRTNNRSLTKKSVTSMLEDAGFELEDMTEIKGLTCFCAQKVKSSSGCD